MMILLIPGEEGLKRNSIIQCFIVSTLNGCQRPGNKEGRAFKNDPVDHFSATVDKPLVAKGRSRTVARAVKVYFSNNIFVSVR
jgi:hypothetical protein